jgi:PadR family transcriptional regulator PadR
LLCGLVRLHIPHHAAKREVYGQWMIGELAWHGYRLSPGTLYPMLKALEAGGYLTSAQDCGGKGGRCRRIYSATELGREALAVARERICELAGEINEPH